MGSDILSPNSSLLTFLEEGDPEVRYKDLEQVGHGNFGAVYCAQDVCENETVAIKKILIDKKDAETRIQDISTELKVLTCLKHCNIVQIKTTFWKPNHIWIVLEYCVGSLVDMLTTLSSTFSESSISYIAKSVLLALQYIHSFNWIHRDVKAANILISSNEIIKLGDLGSTSLKNPTNTFTGSPYWMAPEVILAMEDGEYSCLCDIWSLGITCIEIAESKPPRFEKNAMSALYFIAQSDSPTLTNPELWSNTFNEFINLCLRKTVEERPNCDTLLENEFLNTSDQGRKDFSIIIDGCFYEVETENDNNYRKLKTFVQKIDSEGYSNDSDSPNFAQNSNVNVPISRMATLGQNVHTFKTTSTIVQESLMRENDFFQQHLNDYRQHRKYLNKQLIAFIQKLKNTRVECARVHEKNSDYRSQALERQLEKMKNKLSADFEQLLKSQIQQEKKISKTLNNNQRRMTILKSPSTKSTNNKVSSVIVELNNLRATHAFNRSLFLQQGKLDILTYEKEQRIKLLNDRMDDYFEELQMSKDHNFQIDNVKISHMTEIHTIEIAGFAAYVKKMELQLNKKHLQELKMKPKELKSCENLFKKKHCDKIRDARTIYNKKVMEKQATLSKEEYIKAKNLLKRERSIMLTKLENEFTETLVKEMNDIELCYEATQQKERSEMKSKSNVEYEQLQSYQSLIKQTLLSKMATNRENFLKDTKLSIDEYILMQKSQIKEVEQIADQKLKQIDQDQLNSTMKYEEWRTNKLGEAPISSQTILNDLYKSGRDNKLWGNY